MRKVFVFVLSALGALSLATAGFGQKSPPSPPAPGLDPPSLCGSIAGNLVANCGFETGDFSGWTTTPAAQGSLFGVDGNPNSGNFAAFFGAVTPPFEDKVSQSISTVVGESYDISFWLANGGGPSNQFTATFGGSTLLSLTNSGSFGYTEYTDTVVATSSSTALSFSAYQVPSFFYLDDVSVTAVPAIPEPHSVVFLSTVVSLVGWQFRKKKRLGRAKDRS